MIYTVTINDKQYEVEVEKGKANLVKTTDFVAAAPAAAPVAAAPVQAPAASPSQAVAGRHNRSRLPMPGTILDLKVAAGQSVKEGDLICILEAMKMENEIYSPCAGTIAQVLTSKGASVDTGSHIVTIS